MALQTYAPAMAAMAALQLISFAEDSNLRAATRTLGLTDGQNDESREEKLGEMPWETKDAGASDYSVASPYDLVQGKTENNDLQENDE